MRWKTWGRKITKLDPTPTWIFLPQQGRATEANRGDSGRERNAVFGPQGPAAARMDFFNGLLGLQVDGVGLVAILDDGVVAGGLPLAVPTPRDRSRHRSRPWEYPLHGETTAKNRRVTAASRRVCRPVPSSPRSRRFDSNRAVPAVRRFCKVVEAYRAWEQIFPLLRTDQHSHGAGSQAATDASTGGPSLAAGPAPCRYIILC